MGMLEQYKKVFKKITSTPSRINTFVPTPNEKDYSRGYIIRFFIQQSNDKTSPIYEVSSSNFRRYSSSKLYRGTTLRWRIKGPLDTVFNNQNEITDKGVKESNRIAISIASDKIKNLKLYLPNLLQFYKS